MLFCDQQTLKLGCPMIQTSLSVKIDDVTIKILLDLLMRESKKNKLC